MLNRPTRLALMLLGIALNVHAADKIYIGNVAPLTGVIAELGNEAAQSQKACIDSINARGGIRGKKVEILLRDDGFDPERYVSAATELIEQKKVVALLGGGGTLGIDLLLQRGILEKNQVPVIAPISGALSIRYPFNPYIFHIRASYPDEINRMMDQLEITGRSRIGIVYMNDSEGRAAYGLARLALKKKGMQLVAFSGYNKDLNDIEPAAKAMAAANLDTVIFAGLEEPAGKFLARLRTLGSSAQLYGLSFIDARSLARFAGADNARGTGLTQVMPYPFSSNQPIVKEYRAAMKKFAPKTDISYLGMEMFIGCRVFEEGMKKAGANASGADLIKALENIGTLDLGGFVVSFSPENRLGSKFTDITVIGPDGTLMR